MRKMFAAPTTTGQNERQPIPAGNRNGRVVVVGAGPAGLASAAELGRRGIRATVLEAATEVGWSWRGRYDGLRLNSSRPFSKLP
jgi:cation diffusion facilitator CzcD-associated flavoprotein CzcO